jgi:2-haloacid dehalogenase
MVRALAGQYAEFWQATEDALVFVTTLLHLDLTPDKRAQLREAYLGLQAWPEIPQALQAPGIRLAFLSNATPQILHTGIKNAKLEGLFEHVLSTDQIKTSKPDPRAYQMAIDAFGLRREDRVFVAFAGWDAAGAKWFGYPTFWVNRPHLPGAALGIAPDATGSNLNDRGSFVKALGSSP